MEVVLWFDDKNAFAGIYGKDGGKAAFGKIRIKGPAVENAYSIDEEHTIDRLNRIAKDEEAGFEDIQRVIFVDNSSLAIAQNIYTPRFKLKWMRERAALNNFIARHCGEYEKYTLRGMEIESSREDAVNLLFIAIRDDRIDSFNRISKELGALNSEVYSGAQIFFHYVKDLFKVKGDCAFFYDCGFSLLNFQFGSKEMDITRIKKDGLYKDAHKFLGKIGSDKRIFANLEKDRMLSGLEEMESVQGEYIFEKFELDNSFMERVKEVVS